VIIDFTPLEKTRKITFCDTPKTSSVVQSMCGLFFFTFLGRMMELSTAQTPRTSCSSIFSLFSKRNQRKSNPIVFSPTDERILSTIPTDLLPYIFTFLDPYELCCLDSAILNHTDRPLFLSALIQRFTKTDSKFNSDKNQDLKAKWYICRCIPITDLSFTRVCPTKIVSMNSNDLKRISLNGVDFNHEEFLLIKQCSNLKELFLTQCSAGEDLDFLSLLQGFPSLEILGLSNVSFYWPADHERSPGCCPSLKSIEFALDDGMRDNELRCLVETCPSLRSLILCSLGITNESVRMLIDHRPRIPLISISDCCLSLDVLVPLLREIAIPTLFNSDEDETLQLEAMEYLCSFIATPPEAHPDIEEFLSAGSLLRRFVDIFEPKIPLRSSILFFFEKLTQSSYHQLVVDAGAIPVFSRLYDSYDLWGKQSFFLMIHHLSSHTEYHLHLLSAGILSIFRPQLLDVLSDVRSLPPLSLSLTSSRTTIVSTSAKLLHHCLLSFPTYWFRWKIGSALYLF
jgi:hypothetical protein